MQCEERQIYPPLMMVSTLILSLPQAQSQLQLTQVFQELQELLAQPLKMVQFLLHLRELVELLVQQLKVEQLLLHFMANLQRLAL